LRDIIVADASYPDLHDTEGWVEHISHVDASYSNFEQMLPGDPSVKSERRTIAGVQVVAAAPVKPIANGAKIYLDIHGGGLVYLGGRLVDGWARSIAFRTGASVISVDYRMPPKHPFPAGLDDCLSVYRALVERHGAENLIVGGGSAGGNLAMALLLRARDEGVPLPAGLVLLTPEVDLTESGDTFQTLLGLDRMASLGPINQLYAAGVRLDHPYVSPLFGNFDNSFPPTFLQSGTRDLFLSNTVRMHRTLRKAGVPAELHIWEAMPHGRFLNAPEDLELDDEVRDFIAKIWNVNR